MSFHRWSRQLVLKVPRVGRFYTYATELASSFNDLNEKYHALMHERAHLVEAEKAAQARVIELQTKYNALVQEHARIAEAEQASRAHLTDLQRDQADRNNLQHKFEDCELKLYTARVDYQRAVRTLDDLQTRLSGALQDQQELRAIKAGLSLLVSETQAVNEATLTSELGVDELLQALRAERRQLKERNTELATALHAARSSFSEAEKRQEERYATLMDRLTMIAADTAHMGRSAHGLGSSEVQLTLW